MKLTNCKNCGAVLVSSQCSYCNTIYEVEDEPIKETVVVRGGIGNKKLLTFVLEKGGA